MLNEGNHLLKMILFSYSTKQVNSSNEYQLII